MQFQTKAFSSREPDVTATSMMRQRVRTAHGRLHREAMRRANRAKMTVVLAFGAVLALVIVFYEVLSG